MYYKKVWVIILIIVVVSSLFPSILVYANEGDGGGGAGGIPVEGGEDGPDTDIPDIEYSLQNAPFPGKYGKINEGNWQEFIDRAEQLGHTKIKRFIGYTRVFEDESYNDYRDMNWITFYSTADTSDTDISVHLIMHPDTGKFDAFQIRYNNNESANILTSYGLGSAFGDSEKTKGLLATITGGEVVNWNPYEVIYPIDGYINSEIWYSAEAVNDPYQDKPPRYNIDPSRGWGMSFLKPKFGEWINIPTKTYSHKDTIEIEIQVPHLYPINEDYNYTMFNVSEGVGNIPVPNFGIRLYSNNVKKIEGSQVVGRDGIWILPYQVKYVEGYMDGTYMHGARFIATVPMEHAKNKNWVTSTIVADLFIHKEPFHEDYSVKIPEAKTWTKYTIFYGIVDTDGDGLDDRTGEPINKPKPADSLKDDKPNKEDYPDDIFGTIAYYFDTFIWYIKQPFVFIADLIGNIINWISTTIDNWIDSFASIFTRLFSFLPAEVILMLALGFATLMIITIIRAIRGS